MAAILEDVLSLRQASFTAGAFSGTTGSGGVSMHFQLGRGEMALAWVDELDQAHSVADAVCGLQVPVHGQARFLGTDWCALEATAAQRLRARIGRFFARGAWLPRHSLLDNILLPARHHGKAPVETLLRAAAELAQQFALPGVPMGRVADATRSELARAGCVRALLGQPALILLEAPTDGADPDLAAQLVGALREARDRGSAVLWITRSESVWQDGALPVDQRFRLTTQALVAVSGSHDRGTPGN